MIFSKYLADFKTGCIMLIKVSKVRTKIAEYILRFTFYTLIILMLRN